MDTGCQNIREALVEVGGSADQLGQAERRHLDTCADCADLAADERGLERILAGVIHPADQELEARVMAQIAAARGPRRALALLPVAVSALVVAAGAVLVGGVPGASLLAFLPDWSAQGWFALLAAFSDIGVVLTTAAGAAGAALSPPVQAGAAALALLGAGAVVAVTMRWREAYRWRRRD